MSSSIRTRRGDMVNSFRCLSAGDRRLPPKDDPVSSPRRLHSSALGEAVPSNLTLMTGVSRLSIAGLQPELWAPIGRNHCDGATYEIRARTRMMDVVPG
jgi:hypothetical protein